MLATGLASDSHENNISFAHRNLQAANSLTPGRSRRRPATATATHRPAADSRNLTRPLTTPKGQKQEKIMLLIINEHVNTKLIK